MRLILIVVFSCALAACAVAPQPMTQQQTESLQSEDFSLAFKDVDPFGTHMAMAEAVARGLKYNLDYRAKQMEQAIALGTHELSKYDMLPKVLASAGYNYRNNNFITQGVGAYSGRSAVGEPFVSSAREYSTQGLNLNWSLLDFGVGYFNAKQNGDRILVAGERRRRTMHVLIQDIQTAYLRAAAAQKLKDGLVKTIIDANEALENAQKIEAQGLRAPLESLRYQKSLLDNVKILETISQELATAKVELNQLINLPAHADYVLDDPEKIAPPSTFANVDTKEFELRAMLYNADLNESVYNARIAVEETRKSMLRLIPGLTFNVGPQKTDNNYWINQHWVEGSANISFNLWNLLTGPEVIRLAEQNAELAKHKRLMVRMAVISQVHLAKMGFESSGQLYQRSVRIDAVDSKIAKLTADKEKKGAASQAERVAADASAIISKLRKYQALSQLFAASGKMRATAGLEPDVTALHEISLKDLTGLVGANFDAWNRGVLPALPQSEMPKALQDSEISPVEKK
jgi:outer membrane protein TolC